MTSAGSCCWVNAADSCGGRHIQSRFAVFHNTSLMAWDTTANTSVRSRGNGLRAIEPRVRQLGPLQRLPLHTFSTCVWIYSTCTNIWGRHWAQGQDQNVCKKLRWAWR